MRKASFLPHLNAFGEIQTVEMPFEISTAPENCSRDALKICWKDLMASNLFILTYWFMDVETMTRKLMMILLQRCFERNIKLNKEKIKLKVDSLMYLKFVISKNGLCIDPQKVRAIQAMQQQTGSAANSRDGKLCSTILTQLSEITAVLRSQNADTHFRWDVEVHCKVFKDVKTVLSNTPVLSLFDEHKELALRCNAFGWVLGACLF